MIPTDERTQRSLGSVTIQDGRWEGRQIVPRRYVRTSTREQVETGDGAVGYGYFWWTREVEGYRAFFAAGYDGQRIYVIPELDLVAVIVAEEPDIRCAEASVGRVECP